MVLGLTRSSRRARPLSVVAWLVCVLVAVAVEGMAAPVLLGEFQAGGDIRSSPAVGPDGSVYFGTDAGEFIALQPNGAVRWRVTVGAASQCSPAVDRDGVVYFSAEDGWYRALRPDGSEKWSLGFQASAAPALGTNGWVYVASQGGPLYAVTNGTIAWQRDLGGTFRCSPVIGPDGTIYAGGNQRWLRAFQPDGKELWGREMDAPVLGLALDADATIYAAVGRWLVAVTRTNTLRWTYDSGSGVLSGSPVVAADGTIYVTSTQGFLHAVRPDGTRRWRFETAGIPYSTPAIAQDGTLYFGTDDRVLHGVGPDGIERWRYEATASLSSSSPLLTPEGWLYVGGGQRTLRWFDTQTPPMPSPWPMQGRDPARTGNSSTPAALRVVLRSPDDGSRSLLGEPVELEAIVSGTTASVTNLVFRDGLVELASLSAPPYRFRWTNAPFGQRQVLAVAWTADGRRTESRPAGHWVDTRLAVRVVSPMEGSDVLLPAVTDVVVEAGDPDAPVTGVVLFAGTERVGAVAGGVGLTAFRWTNPPPGLAILTAVATNSLGNVRTSAPVSIQVYSSGALVGRPDAYSGIEDSPLEVGAPGVLANDINNSADRADAILVTPPALGSLALSPSGGFRFVPPPNVFGEASFEYRLQAPGRTSAVVRVNLALAGVNDAPVVSDERLTTFEDAPRELLLTPADADGDALTVEVLTPPTRGWLYFPGGSTPIRLVYTPFPDVFGTDRFTYRVRDGVVASAAATITLDVAPVPEVPVARADSYPVSLAQMLRVAAADGVLANDDDPDRLGMTAVVETPTQHGTLTMAPDGSFTYAAEAGFQGVDRFEYRAANATGAGPLVAVTLRVGDPQWTGEFAGSPPLGSVRSLLVDAGGDLWVGGSPLPVADRQESGVARWDGVQWRTAGNPIFPGPAGVVNALVEWRGSLIAAGEFQQAGGRTVQNLARWDGHQWHSLGLGFNGPIYALSRMGSNLVAGGDFTAGGGVVATNLAVWDGTAWSAVPGNPDGPVRTLLEWSPDVVVAGGDFLTVAGTPSPHLARWNGANWSSFQSGLDGSVLALARQGDDLLVGGRFQRAGGMAATNVARWRNSGWEPLGAGVSGGFVGSLLIRDSEVWAGEGNDTGIRDQTVSIHRWDGTAWTTLPLMGNPEYPQVAALVQRGTEVIAGGYFDRAGGQVVRHLARWNGESWSGFDDSLAGWEVHSVLRQGSNLVVAGLFSSAGNRPAVNLAIRKGSQWAKLGGPSVGDPDGPILSMVAGEGEEFFAGGDFTHWGGQNIQRLARWDGAAWHSVGGGANGAVRALLRTPYGGLLAGGGFNRIGGKTILGLARWDGSEWSAVGVGGELSGSVEAMVYRGADLIVAGAFREAGGKTVNHIARWDGVEWHSLGAGISPNGYAATLAVRGNDLFVGGQFVEAGEVPAANVARWNGMDWFPVATRMAWPGRNLGVYSMAVAGDALLIGGDFAEVDGVPALGVARWKDGGWFGLGSGVGTESSNVRVQSLTTDERTVILGGSFQGAGGGSQNLLATWELPQPVPRIVLAQPTNGAVLRVDQPVAMLALAQSAAANVAITRVEFYADDVRVGTATQAPFSFRWPAGAAGRPLLSARVSDSQGQVAWSAPVSVTLHPPESNANPVVNLMAPTSGSVLTVGVPFRAQFTATDSDGQVVEVRLFEGSQLLGIAVPPQSFVTVSDLPRGVHVLQAEAVDNFGATSRSAPVQVTLNTPPEVYVDQPREGDEYPVGETIRLQADARDFEGPISRVDFLTNGVFLATATEFSSPNAVYRWVAPPAGSYALTAVAYDADGAPSTSMPVRFRVAVANQLPVARWISPMSGQRVSAPTNLVLQAEASDPDGTVRAVDFFNDDQYLGGVTNPPFAFVLRNVTAADYGFRVRVTDDRNGIVWTEPTRVTVTHDPGRMPRYLVTDLGTLGGDESRAWGINNLGWVVGMAETAGNDRHSFLYTNGVMIDLTTRFPVVGYSSEALSINDTGQIVGFPSENSEWGYRVEFNGTNHFILRTPEVRRNLPRSINASGQVVGSVDTYDLLTRGFILKDGEFSLIVPATGESTAFASNDDGTVVGRVGTPSGVRGFWRTPGGVMELLGTLGGSFSEARDINRTGVIAGSSMNPAEQLRGAFFYNGFVVDLGTLGGTQSTATAVNVHGQIVGNANTPFSEQHAFLWHGCVLYDLNQLIGTNSPWTLVSATDINDRGQIVGTGYRGFDRNESRAFLLTLAPDSPVKPEDNVVLGVRGDSFCACLPVASGQPFVIEASPDLRFWTPVSTNYNRDGLLDFSDPQAGTNGQRFYRFAPLPEE